MNINYCLPLIEKDKAKIINIINHNSNTYQYFEIWLDYIEDMNEKFIDQLMGMLQDKLIILFRRKNLEKIHMPREKRFAIMQQLSNSSSLLDLDIALQKEELEFYKEINLSNKLILSYHNYHQTPDAKELMAIIQIMSLYKPAIYKVATFCKNEQDALTLLQLQQTLKEQQKKQIVLGMGEFGTITRVYGTLWGNEMIFAPQETRNESAPGQLTKMQLESIFKELT